MSQEDSKVVTVGDDKYRIYMLDPLVAGDLAADLAAIVLPSAGVLFSGKPGEKTKIDEGGWERAATLFFTKFDKTKQREFIAILTGVTAVVKGPSLEPQLEAIFSTHFRGRVGAMYKWLAAALKVQFASFFDEIAPAIKSAVRGLGLERSSSPPTSPDTTSSGV